MEEKKIEEVERLISRIEKLSSISVEEWELLYDRVYALFAEAERPEDKAFLQKAKKELRKFKEKNGERVRE